ncbi:putative ribonuclease H-like domain-containing protein [Tanacetum coccineum]
MDDLYNNLKVYESKNKGQSSSNSQNVAFVSSENTSSTNEAVNTAHEVSTASSQGQSSSSTYADDVMFSFFAKQSNSLKLDNEDLEQIDTDDLEEMDLKWQVAMLTMRVECYNCHRRGHFNRECRVPRNQGYRNGDAPRRVVPVETPANALVVQDGIGGYDWVFQAEEGIINFALMAYTSQGSSSSSSSDSKNEAVYEEDIAFLMYDVQVKDISIKDLKNQLEETLKEKDDLKIKLEKFEDSSRNLTKLINSQISAKDKAGLGYDSQINESEVVHSVFNSRESDVENSPVNDRFKTVIAPTAVLTKSGIVPISAARKSSSRAVAPASVARPINTVAPKPFVNVARPRPNAFHKSHSPSRTLFNQQTTLKNRNLNDKVNMLRHMTGNKFYLLDYQDIDGRFIAFGGSSKGGKITGKGNQTNGNAGTKENIDAGQAKMSAVPGPQYVLLPFLTFKSQNPKTSKDKIADDAGKKNGVEDPTKEDDINWLVHSFTIVDPGRARDQRNEFESVFGQDKDANSTYRMFTPDTAILQDTGIFGIAYDDKDMGEEADLSNLETTMSVSPISTTRIHKDRPKE